MAELDLPIISLRKLSRVAPELPGPVHVVHGAIVIGDYIPRVATPRSAQDGPLEVTHASAGADSPLLRPPEVPARSGAPRQRTPAPGDAPRPGLAQAERDAVLRRVNRGTTS
jgi:hypothetical protein